jgi:hypothetical protein
MKVPAAIKSLKCSSILMESVARVAAIARMLPKLSARAAPLSTLVATMPLLCKSHMESGADFQKMIA